MVLYTLYCSNTPSAFPVCVCSDWLLRTKTVWIGKHQHDLEIYNTATWLLFKYLLLVYLITCCKCHAITVKSTQNMMQRRHNRRNKIRGILTTLGRHFSKCWMEQLSLQITGWVRLRNWEDEIAKGRWISRLATTQGDGSILLTKKQKIKDDIRHLKNQQKLTNNQLSHFLSNHAMSTTQNQITNEYHQVRFVYFTTSTFLQKLNQLKPVRNWNKNNTLL